MSSFAGSIAGLFVCGMVGGYAGLCLLAPTPEAQTMKSPASPIRPRCRAACRLGRTPIASAWRGRRPRDGDQAKRANPLPTTVGLSLDPAIRRQAATPGARRRRCGGCPGDPGPGAGRTPAAKARTASPCQDEAARRRPEQCLRLRRFGAPLSSEPGFVLRLRRRRRIFPVTAARGVFEPLSEQLSQKQRA